MTATTYKVDGMTCHHCVMAVTEELSKIPGVSGVEVDLVPEQISTVTVTSAAPLDHKAVDEAIDEAGYALV
jgi:copper chaperone CopZ